MKKAKAVLTLNEIAKETKAASYDQKDQPKPSAVQTQASFFQNEVKPAQKAKTRRVYKAEITDEKGNKIFPLHAKFFPTATFPQHFTFCVNVYLNMLGSPIKQANEKANIHFLRELRQHPDATSILGDNPTNASILESALELILSDKENYFIDILPQLIIPGVKSCKIIIKEVTVVKSRTPIKQEPFELPAEVKGILSKITNKNWQGLSRYFADKSVKHVAWLRLPEEKIVDVQISCLLTGLKLMQLLAVEKEKPGKRVLMININDIARLIHESELAEAAVSPVVTLKM